MPDTKALRVIDTTIPGLKLLDLPVHGDNRGWFKENWQREKMIALGLPDFGPVQNNVSFNTAVGTTRGIHAEPWDKFISIASGRIFGAWVDLRRGPTFGTVFTAELDPSQAIFVPRGVGNSYQTLEADTVYSYLVNDHWSPAARYTFLNLADKTAAIEWPIPLENAELSEKDKAHPHLDQVDPVAPRKRLVVGANGQLGRALQQTLANAEFMSRDSFDITDDSDVASIAWSDYDTIINAAAYTNVDSAETPEGRTAAWSINVSATAKLAQVALRHGLTYVHVSSDYVFDGTRLLHDEAEAASPLGVYGQTKAAADAIISTLPRHYIVRTSWVIGDGGNFVRTMQSLAKKGVDPKVVDDQIGRLTFTVDLAEGIDHLLSVEAPYGTYNLTNEGEPQSWADIATLVYAMTGHDANRVTGVSTAEYFAGRASAPRPLNSVLDLTKLTATGFVPRDSGVALQSYLA